MTALRASCFNYLVARAWGMGEILGPHNGRENDSLWPRKHQSRKLWRHGPSPGTAAVPPYGGDPASIRL